MAGGGRYGRPFGEIALRLTAAWIAGAGIGLDRSYHDKPAGFRTYSLVALASALLMSTTAFQHGWLRQEPTGQFTSDPMRIAQGILTGIGFLGAGTIFRERQAMRGLTTAASIWMAATLGILYGAGFYVAALAGTIGTFVTLIALRGLESRLPSWRHALCEVQFAKEKALSEDDLRTLLHYQEMGCTEMGYRLSENGTALEYRLTLRTRDKTNFGKLARTLVAIPDVIGFRISPTDD
jgi:putative Mg2+ transporter-C (MgtC) family protein